TTACATSSCSSHWRRPPRREARKAEPDDGGSIHVRSPFDEFDPYHTTSTATILRPLADGTMQMSFFIGKRRHDFQMRRAQD
ncbi:hypothetical protein ACVSM1_01970, partial [Pseudomonas aeruginosa]